MPVEEALGVIIFEGFDRDTYKNLRNRALEYEHKLFLPEYALHRIHKEAYLLRDKTSNTFSILTDFST
jgi:molybdopterin synthase catalytic subunit